MRPDPQRTPAGPGDPVRDPARATALHRLAGATAPAPAVPAAPAAPHREPLAAAVGEPGETGAAAPWTDRDPDGRRPGRTAPVEPDVGAWADPPWWARIRWAPEKVAGIALVVVVVALGGFSVHRLLAAVPESAAVPELPMAQPGETVPADGPAPATPTDPEGRAAGGTAVEPARAEEPLVVSVVGLVERSGLVTLDPGARVADALDGAGGVLEGGDRDGLNLARRVADGEQILVGLAPGPDGPVGPRSGVIGADSGSVAEGGAGAAPAAPGDAPADDGLVDLNTADASGLESLPGVGPVTAAAILSWRDANGSFSSIDQLTEVNGIGPATLQRLRPLVTV